MAEREFASTGLAPSLAFVVMTVNSQPGIAAGDLARVMQLQPSTVTRLVDKLVKDGYLLRKTEGKFIHVFPDQRAAQVGAGLKEAWSNLNRRYTEILGEEESRRMTGMIADAGEKIQ
jgi:DNA-binding MarR family transcriptional regulator